MRYPLNLKFLKKTCTSHRCSLHHNNRFRLIRNCKSLSDFGEMKNRKLNHYIHKYKIIFMLRNTWGMSLRIRCKSFIFPGAFKISIGVFIRIHHHTEAFPAFSIVTERCISFHRRTVTNTAVVLCTGRTTVNSKGVSCSNSVCRNF